MGRGDEKKLKHRNRVLNNKMPLWLTQLVACDRSGSPSMEDIEAFCTTYRARLDEAEIAKSIPENTSLEVFSYL